MLLKITNNSRRPIHRVYGSGYVLELAGHTTTEVEVPEQYVADACAFIDERPGAFVEVMGAVVIEEEVIDVPVGIEVEVEVPEVKPVALPEVPKPVKQASVKPHTHRRGK